MKRFIDYILFCCTAVFIMTACDKESVQITESDRSADHIVLSLLTRQVETKLTAAEFKSMEDMVMHIDVLIFDNDGNGGEAGSLLYYERINSPQADTEINLGAKRHSFAKNELYWVYVLANSTAASTAFSGLSDMGTGAFGELCGMTQTDPRIYLTGPADGNNDNPKAFLMDGIAFTGTSASNQAVVLYSDESNVTNLKVSLARAAAKIVVNISQSGLLTFDSQLGMGGYSYTNLPYSTSVLAGQQHTSSLRRSDLYSGDYFDNMSDQTRRTITSYAYSRDWSTLNTVEATRMVVNIPAKYNGVDHQYNYYQIPVSQEKRLERNHVYVVNVELAIPGATDPSEPVVVEDMTYQVQEWEDTYVNVGDASLKPSYLTLNQYDLNMYNVDSDATTLQFASSSEVTATVTRAYYYNKFGALTSVNPSAYNIRVVPEAGINGGLTVYSDVPDNNTIRYIEFTVTNKEGISRNVTVQQYPLIYVTNIQSYYSYRSDFVGTGGVASHYENLSRRNNITKITADKNNRGVYSYTRESGYDYYEDSFWRSKVVRSVNSDGSSNIDYYYWDGGELSHTNAEDPGNARMYHVRVTATSETYKLANPKITAGVTDPGSDNARLVAPSFMIASRLGFVNTGQGVLQLSSTFNQNDLDLVAEHCENYVEVYQDEKGNSVHLDDWRLPTAAEIDIILQVQGREGVNADAIDYLLNAGYYYSASGPVANDKSTSEGVSVRCIRNAY